jgi:phospholipase C
VHKGATDPMPIGPGHEFMDTMTQLCGNGIKNPFPKGPYPAIDNLGFVASYVEEGATNSKDAQDVMNCCYSEKQVPILWNLAKEFAVCDNWFSSMPGPTWPNRLFAMGGSSAGLDDSPTDSETADWELDDGFHYQNGSFFDQLRKNERTWRLYNDFDNRFAKDPASGADFGWVSIVGGLANISKVDDVHDIGDFPDDINNIYPYTYTWIEPNYGDATGDFGGGSSQHPDDSLRAGEVMIGNVYNWIRTSPYWATSVFIVTYDEHGGFYDHVAPPAAVKPGDNYGKGLNTNGFDFSQYGVRVPAVVISPWIPAGTVSHTLYDHTSILATVENLFDVPSLTDRDAGANDVTSLLSLDAPRADALPFGKMAKWIQTDSETTSFAAVPGPSLESDTTPLPERGNVHGFLRIAAKTDFELSDGSPASKAAIKAKVLSIRTKGEARAYIRSVGEKVRAARAAPQAGTATG